MKGCVPLDGEELHAADGVIILGLLKVTLQQFQRHAPEVVH